MRRIITGNYEEKLSQEIMRRIMRRNYHRKLSLKSIKITLNK
jgi:hypothetical protein